jgi:hypothetical protein
MATGERDPGRGTGKLVAGRSFDDLHAQQVPLRRDTGPGYVEKRLETVGKVEKRADLRHDPRDPGKMDGAWHQPSVDRLACQIDELAVRHGDRPIFGRVALDQDLVDGSLHARSVPASICATAKRSSPTMFE